MSENKDGRGRKPNQRMQHFLVLQYLLEHSDANHYVKAKDLLEYLKVSCDILVKERSLDPSDARLLVEALHTARFVTERDTEYIADQVGSFLSEYQREQIKHDKPIFEKNIKKGKMPSTASFPWVFKTSYTSISNYPQSSQ